MGISEKVNQLFVENYEDVDKEDIKKELSAMRAAQPPSYPTFMVGQNEIKAVLKQNLTRSFRDNTFFHTVVVGEVGGGKTHLLNMIKSRFTDDLCYIVQFRAEETEETGYSFPKMIVALLFNLYYDEFKKSFLNIDLSEIRHKYSDTERANGLASYLSISLNVAEALYRYVEQDENKSSALRVIGGCENTKDLTRLKINKLVDKDYMDILELFLKYNNTKKYLLVMLDEFEHSYTLFTPAKRRNFLKGYKAFLDRFSKSGSWPFFLITAATVQYKGQLQESLSRIDTALASRLGPQTLMLNEFNVASDEDFKNLYQEIAKRYKDVYNYDVGYNGFSKMRKKIFEKLDTASAQRMAYRDVISSMITLMDEMERKGESFNTTTAEITGSITVIQEKNSLYELEQKEMEAKWNSATGKTKLTMIKKGVESLLEVYIEDFENKKIGSGKGGNAIILFKENDSQKLIYIALQGLKDKLISCKKIKETKQAEQNINIDAYFVYLPGEGIEEQLKYYPDIITCNIDTNRLDLLILGNKNDLGAEVTTIISNNLQDLSEKLIGRGLK